MPDTRIRQRGFTLIELVAVIVVLGIVAAIAVPRFINFFEGAINANMVQIAANYKAGVDQVNAKWLAAGSPGPKLNFIPLPAAQAGGDLSVNANGWPADTRGVSLTLNSGNDCLDVWRAVLSPGAPSVSLTLGAADFHTQYLGANSCRYRNEKDLTKHIEFNSNTGIVVTNL
ncbi:prepilin-type N-terminal cleavage/methylation domain-containing protein [Simiduia agarivorans]|uniref:Pilin n=1 Tax=Simiduia agarivorans (strain DSM 21679 / JCM 13881 / BCRC 17597 / SA1) TaxID=1117647 RepID=K4KJL4_SIMAS|nr:prepilin-type N-terminal cleavage/methylation domain-containing protein [Simiduia agarivorans]AFU99344.1 pilin [Simiduia agarivorans SA1 = DSM 21679]